MDREGAIDFGNAEGSQWERNVSIDTVGWDWEADIMSAYDGILGRPNVKRARIADLIASFGVLVYNRKKVNSISVLSMVKNSCRPMKFRIATAI